MRSEDMLPVALGEAVGEEAGRLVGRALVRHAQPLAHFASSGDPSHLCSHEAGGGSVGQGVSYDYNRKHVEFTRAEWRDPVTDKEREIAAVNGGDKLYVRNVVARVTWAQVGQVIRPALHGDLLDRMRHWLRERNAWVAAEPPFWESTPSRGEDPEWWERREVRRREWFAIERACYDLADEAWEVARPLQDALF